jgi:hypothetical protein
MSLEIDDDAVPLVIHGRLLWMPGRPASAVGHGPLPALPLIGRIHYQDLFVAMSPTTLPVEYSCTLVGAAAQQVNLFGSLNPTADGTFRSGHSGPYGGTPA